MNQRTNAGFVICKAVRIENEEIVMGVNSAELESVRINLNVEQVNEIILALKDRIEELKKQQERCRELEIACENPLFEREYKKMVETYDTWIKDVEAVLEHIECETSEIRP